MLPPELSGYGTPAFLTRTYRILNMCNNKNSRLDATMIILLTILISSTYFGRNYRPKYVELIEIINKINIVASSRLFLLLYQRCTVTQISNL